MFIAVVEWDAEERVTKYQDFKSEQDARDMVAGTIQRYPEAFVAPAPKGGPRDWKVSNGALVSDAIVDPKPPTGAEKAEAQMTTDHFIRGWVKRQALKEGKTPRAIMDEIKIQSVES